MKSLSAIIFLLSMHDSIDADISLCPLDIYPQKIPDRERMEQDKEELALLVIYGECDRVIKGACDTFRLRYPDRPRPTPDTLTRLIHNRKTHGQFVAPCCKLKPVVDNEAHEIIVLRYFRATGLTIRDILPTDPSKYDKMRPPKRDGNPTIVHFHVTVMGLDSIDENSMTYAADIFFAQTWKDHRLRLPENMTTEYRLLEVEWLKKMWRPDSFFKNAKSVTFQTMTIPNHYMWLYKDKTILYMVKLTLRLSCAMNFMIYPHDTQECKLQMESLSHTTDDMIFEWDPDVPLVVDENIELPQLALVKNNTADCTQVYSTGNFTCLEVVFLLKRRLGYYLFHTYIPTCLIVIMSWVSFWIKPEAAPARVTLGVTSLLTLSTQHAKSQAALPPVSYLKAVDGFMSVCTIFVFMALMEYCLVNIVLGDSDAPKKPAPKNPPGVSDKPTSENSFAGSKTKSTVNIAERQRNRAINIDRFSRVFFPLLFTILNCTYWILFAEYI